MKYKKKILITGKNSYIGTSFEKWILENHDGYFINSIDMHGDEWKKHDFSQYDVILHVAGIAHRKVTKKNRDLYYRVNRDLAYETALKAKSEGVKQFILLSSMSVYGVSTGEINFETVEKPKNAYGKSKLEAEKLISKLEDEEFIVSILRPPMVYGPGCKGNYVTLSKFAKVTPIFPKIDNKRSMIFVDNLSLFIHYIIQNKLKGLYLPQNLEIVNTRKLVFEISKLHNHKIVYTGIFNKVIKSIENITVISKVFGDLYYETNLPDALQKQVNFEKSIRITERVDDNE